MKKKMISVFNEFAPQLVTDENEIKNMIYHIISSVDIHQSGQKAVMGTVMPRLKGKVDMKVANKVLVEILKKSGEM